MSRENKGVEKSTIFFFVSHFARHNGVAWPTSLGSSTVRYQSKCSSRVMPMVGHGPIFNANRFLVKIRERIFQPTPSLSSVVRRPSRRFVSHEQKWQKKNTNGYHYPSKFPFYEKPFNALKKKIPSPVSVITGPAFVSHFQRNEKGRGKKGKKLDPRLFFLLKVHETTAITEFYRVVVSNPSRIVGISFSCFVFSFPTSSSVR